MSAAADQRACPGCWSDAYDVPVLVIGDAIDWQCKRNPVAVRIKLDGMEPHIAAYLCPNAIKLFGDTSGELFEEPAAETFRASQRAS